MNSSYDSERLLQAMNIDPTKEFAYDYITFDEFLWGIAFLDLDVPHQAPFATARTIFIFRYYARGKSFLEFDDMMTLARDMENVNYKGMLNADQAKKLQIQDAEAFFKEAGVPSKGNGSGLNFVKFMTTAEKLSSKRKYFDLDKSLRGMRSLLKYLKTSPIFERGGNLGRNIVEIIRMRENVCPNCANKEPIKLAKHTVKTFYNGNITEVWVSTFAIIVFAKWSNLVIAFLIPGQLCVDSRTKTRKRASKTLPLERIL